MRAGELLSTSFRGKTGWYPAIAKLRAESKALLQVETDAAIVPLVNK